MCLIFPVVAFFGCGTTNYYNFSFRVSGGGNCEASGFSSLTCAGTFEEGATVAITATPSEGERFLGWVYRKTNLIVNGEGGYSVTPTSKGGSVLKFASSQNREGQYTAVFSSTDKNTGENLVEYVQLDEFKFEKVDDEDLQDVLFNVTEMDILQGATPALEYSFNFQSSDTPNGLSTTANQTYKVADYLNVHKVLLLTSINDPTTPKSVKANVFISSSRANMSKELIKVYFQASTEDVNYSNGVYEVKFNFNYSGEEYRLVLVYKILGLEDVSQDTNQNSQNDFQENL